MRQVQRVDYLIAEALDFGSQAARQLGVDETSSDDPRDGFHVTQPSRVLQTSLNVFRFEVGIIAENFLRGHT